VHVVPSISTVFEEMVAWDLYFPLERWKEITQRAFDVIEYEDVDPARREVITATGSAVKLTNLEFRPLHLLMSHQTQVLDSNLITNRVWGYSGGGNTVLLKNLVCRLRRKSNLTPASPAISRP